MQTLTTELLAAQQSNGKTPAMTAIAYNDVMQFTTQSSTNFVPGPSETFIASDSCVINSPLAGQGIASVFVTKKASTNQYNFYFRFVKDGNYTTSANWQSGTLLFSISTTNQILLGVSITSDNYQNSTSNYLTVGYLYADLTGSPFVYRAKANVYTINASAVLTQSGSTYSSAENFPYSINTLSVISYYEGKLGFSAIYDSVKGYGAMFYDSLYSQAGTNANNYIIEGDWTLKYATINGSTSGWGTDGVPYVLPFKVSSSCLSLSVVYQNSTFYGAFVGYFQDIPGNALRTFTFNGYEFNTLPFEINGSQDVSSSTSSTVYGPQGVKLTIANLGFSATSYPVLTSQFVLTYSYTAQNVALTEFITSNDFIHWGNRRLINSSSVIQAGLFNTNSNYLILQNVDQDTQIYQRNVTTTDISNDIVSWTITKSPDITPSTLQLKVINNYLGNGASSPNALVKDGLIKMQIGYTTTLGDEVVTDGWYYIDNLVQSTVAGDNTADISARDALKQVQLASYNYQLQFTSQVRVETTDMTAQQFGNLFSQINNISGI